MIFVLYNRWVTWKHKKKNARNYLTKAHGRNSWIVAFPSLLLLLLLSFSWTATRLDLPFQQVTLSNGGSLSLSLSLSLSHTAASPHSHGVCVCVEGREKLGDVVVRDRKRESECCFIEMGLSHNLFSFCFSFY